jgi:HSP20 family protein
MENITLYDTDCSIYPGDYVPLLNAEEIEEELKLSHEGEALFPPVNITELADSFKVEVAIPGVRREDFLLHTDGNVLFVRVLHKEYVVEGSERFQLHEFNYQCFDRHVVLPDNADAEFISAEYKAGILRLYIPKSDQPAISRHMRIVVY